MREVIGGYELQHVLGEGGMGVVHLAEHAVLRRRVAIKLLSPFAARTSGTVERFFEEAQVTGLLEDPGIVQIFDFGYHIDGRAYFVMEYLDGERLDQRLARVGPLPPTVALRIIQQVASALQAAHARGVLHRDLKPDNVLLVRDPAVVGGERAKVIDFGIAKLMDCDVSQTHAHTGAGMIVGTPRYMSPEQCCGRDLDPRSDVYSLGCVMYFLLTGRPPFDHRSSAEVLAAQISEVPWPPSRFRPAVSPAVDRLLARCLAKDREHRIASMADLVDEIERVTADPTTETIGGDPTVSGRPPPVPTRERPSFRARLAVVMLASFAFWGGGRRVADAPAAALAPPAEVPAATVTAEEEGGPPAVAVPALTAPELPRSGRGARRGQRARGEPLDRRAPVEAPPGLDPLPPADPPPAVDAGPAPVDAGPAPAVDAGPAPVDARPAPAVDAGAAPAVDTGPPVAEAPPAPPAAPPVEPPAPPAAPPVEPPAPPAAPPPVEPPPSRGDDVLL